MKFNLDRQKIGIFLLAAVGILLIVFSGRIGTSPEETETEGYTDVSFYTGYLESRIRELCLSVDGIAEAAVFLTLDCSSEYVYSGNSASDVLILSDSDGEEAVMLYEIYPRVRGVAVVCTGGDLPRVQETVTGLLSAALGLPSSKIKIAGG